MTADTIIAAGRRAAEALMSTTCLITRDGEKVWNEDDGVYTDVDQTVYTGRCRLRFSSARVSARSDEGQLLAVQQLVLYLPIVGTSTVHVDDVVTITDGGPDPALTGTKYRVKGLFAQSYATARRLPVESVT